MNTRRISFRKQGNRIKYYLSRQLMSNDLVCKFNNRKILLAFISLPNITTQIISVLFYSCPLTVLLFQFFSTQLACEPQTKGHAPGRHRRIFKCQAYLRFISRSAMKENIVRIIARNLYARRISKKKLQATKKPMCCVSSY